MLRVELDALVREQARRVANDAQMDEMLHTEKRAKNNEIIAAQRVSDDATSAESLALVSMRERQHALTAVLRAEHSGENVLTAARNLLAARGALIAALCDGQDALVAAYPALRVEQPALP